MGYAVIGLLVLLGAEAGLIYYFWQRWQSEKRRREGADSFVTMWSEMAKDYARENAELFAALVARNKKEAAHDRQAILASPTAAASAERVRSLARRSATRPGSGPDVPAQ